MNLHLASCSHVLRIMEFGEPREQKGVGHNSQEDDDDFRQQAGAGRFPFMPCFIQVNVGYD